MHVFSKMKQCRILVASMIARVWIGDEFSKLKNFGPGSGSLNPNPKHYDLKTLTLKHLIPNLM